MPQKSHQADQEGTGVEPGDGAADAAAVAERRPARPTPRMLPPFKVLLHNDDVNEFLYVIAAIIKLTSLSQEDAVQRTLEAHETGVSLLLVTHKERAELIQEQFASCNLTVTIEPDTV